MPFRYCSDFLFLLSSAAYALNRWFLKPRLHSPFLRNWLSDLLLVPCAIPLVLWIFRRLNLRARDNPPAALELAWILMVWSILFEWIGPKLIPWTTADWHDVLMYWAGGLVAWTWWNRNLFPGFRLRDEL